MKWAAIVWLLLLVVFLAAEAATVGMVSLWFAAGSLIALLTAAFVTGGLLLAAVRGTDGPDLQALSLIALMVPLGLLTSLALPRVLPIDPLIMALTIFYGAFIIIANIITDLITAAIDPRIRLK